MYYKVYLDVLFVTNFLMDYMILRLLSKLLKLPSGRIRCMLGGAFGALGVCLMVLLPVRKNLAILLLAHVVTSTFMVKIGCRIKDIRDWIKKVFLLYFIGFLWGGMFFALYQSPIFVHLRNFLLISVISYELLSLATDVYGRIKRYQSHCCEVTLYAKEKSKKVKGLYDTGNHLVDPLTNKPVSVVSSQVIESMFVTPLEYNEELKPHYISYHAIGTDQGVLLVVTLDEMRVDMQGKTYTITNPVVALSTGKVSFAQHYQLILNPDLIDC